MKKKLLLFIAVIIISCKGIAQNNSEEKQTKQNTITSVDKKIFSPQSPSSSSIVSPITKLNLESDFGEQKASATIGFRRDVHAFTISVEQPFDKKPKKVTPLSLDGLETGTSISFSYQVSFWKPDNSLEVANKFNEIKTKYYIRTAQKIKSTLINTSSLVTSYKNGVTNYYYTNNSTSTVDSIKVDSIVFLKNNEAQVFYNKNIDENNLDTLDSSNIREISYQKLDQDAKDEFDKIIKWKAPIYLYLSAGYAKNNIDYIDSAGSINTQSINKVNQSYKATLAKIFNPNKRNTSVLAFSFILSNTYETASDPVEYSFPAGTMGARYTKEITVGSPSRKLNKRVAAEWRRSFVNTGWIKNYAISPSLTYIFHKKSISLNLPIYFLQFSEDGKFAGLQGGVSLGYLTKVNQSRLTSFNEGFGANLFIAAPFNIFSSL